MVTNLRRKVPAAALALILSCTSAAVANADTQNAENVQKPEPITTHELSPADMDAAQRNMETLFTTLLHQDNGKWVVNEKEARETGTSVKELQTIANSLNGRDANGKPQISTYHSVKSPEYRKCVLNAVGLGGLTASATGGGSQLAYLIAVKNWKEVAWVLARLVGVNALKGGVAGAAAALAGGGAWCATKWAS